MRSKFLKEVHPSWSPFLTEKIERMLEEIEEKIGQDYTPQEENVLRFLKEDLGQKKVVWLGQDPYFQPGVANGRSFQPANLESWEKPFKQVSLKNIVRLIHKSYHHIEDYEEIFSYKNILREIKSGDFPMKPPQMWFDSLESQGTLFLNTSFTCKVNEPNSHKIIWQQFTEELLPFISSQKPDMIWFLWGKEAIKNKDIIGKGVFYESRHPMMCSGKYEDDFLKSKCFECTFDIIQWLG